MESLPKLTSDGDVLTNMQKLEMRQTKLDEELLRTPPKKSKSSPPLLDADGTVPPFNRGSTPNTYRVSVEKYVELLDFLGKTGKLANISTLHRDADPQDVAVYANKYYSGDIPDVKKDVVNPASMRELHLGLTAHYVNMPPKQPVHLSFSSQRGYRFNANEDCKLFAALLSSSQTIDVSFDAAIERDCVEFTGATLPDTSLMEKPKFKGPEIFKALLKDIGAPEWEFYAITGDAAALRGAEYTNHRGHREYLLPIGSSMSYADRNYASRLLLKNARMTGDYNFHEWDEDMLKHVGEDLNEGESKLVRRRNNGPVLNMVAVLCDFDNKINNLMDGLKAFGEKALGVKREETMVLDAARKGKLSSVPEEYYDRIPTEVKARAAFIGLLNSSASNPLEALPSALKTEEVLTCDLSKFDEPLLSQEHITGGGNPYSMENGNGSRTPYTPLLAVPPKLEAYLNEQWSLEEDIAI